MFIRHAEKPDLEGGVLGVDARGALDPGGLSVTGWQRAGALVRLFDPHEESSSPSRIQRPVAVFAASDTGKSWRPRLTVEPLARSLGLIPETRFGSQDDPQAVMEAVLACDGPVLVCWRHRALPALAACFARSWRVPAEWPSERFDLVWDLYMRGTEWLFTASSQNVLPGDGEGGRSAVNGIRAAEMGASAAST